MKETKQAILSKIKEYDTIILFRHVRCDGDCIGSTKGLKRIIKLSFPDKSVYIADSQRSEYLAFLGHDEDGVTDAMCEGALAIVLDTASSDRISDKRFSLCREIIKIDHHIQNDHYGDMRWVEEERTSTSEMITDFYSTFRDELTIDAEAATYLYVGMVTDSGRFRFRGVSEETMKLAGLLISQGIDIDTIYANLYIQNYSSLKFKSFVYRKMQTTDSGVVYITVSRATQKKFGLNAEEASNAVSYLEGIRGSLIWLAFIENPDKTYRVRLRSRFVTVSEIAERFGGGGHANASGASVKDKKGIKALVSDADKVLGEYKKNNEGWL